MRSPGLVRWGICHISTGTPLGSYIPTNYAVARCCIPKSKPASSPLPVPAIRKRSYRWRRRPKIRRRRGSRPFSPKRDHFTQKQSELPADLLRRFERRDRENLVLSDPDLLCIIIIKRWTDQFGIFNTKMRF
jgi:hypothetical protein